MYDDCIPAGRMLAVRTGIGQVWDCYGRDDRFEALMQDSMERMIWRLPQLQFDVPKRQLVLLWLMNW